MGEDKRKEEKAISENIEEILRERDRLDQILREKFKKEVVILFTDICGYTTYTETHGDINSRAILQKHNEIVLPAIEKNEGIVIKTIGDAVMASFSNPLNAVKAASGIQKDMEEYNRKAEEVNQIHVKIGINKGAALVESFDVYGDAVNVASRIQSQAGANQILISTSVYEAVKGVEDILCKHHGAVRVKGKAEPLELYRVVWQDEDIIISTAPRVRAYETAALKRAKNPLRILQLKIARDNNHLKISATEHLAEEESTIRQYEEVSVSMDWIDNKCREIVEKLNTVNRKGHFGRDVLVRLRENGQVFYDRLFPSSIKEKIKRTKAEYLSLNIDDKLVQVPWELLNDGQEFLCQRFNMGRLVETKQSFQGIRSRLLARPLKMLIIADTKGDLKGAYEEGAQILNYMAQHSTVVNTMLRSKEVSPTFLREKMRYFDIIHFAGHADYNAKDPEKSGWRLSEGNLTSLDIMGIAQISTMPALIFTNACQSARTEDWALRDRFQEDIFGLANAFLLAGVRHYIGTFWEILDEPGKRFAFEFYKHLFSGITIGEAIRETRRALIKEYGEESIVWGSYLLYGDPTINYMDQVKVAEAEEEQDVPAVAASDAMVRSHEVEMAYAGEKEKKFPAWMALTTGAVIALLAVILILLINQGKERQVAQKITPSSGIVVSQSLPGATDSDFQKTIQIIHLLSAYQAQLIEKFKEKGLYKEAEGKDPWTSTPISICMISPHWEKIDQTTATRFKPYFEMIFKRMTEGFTQKSALGLSLLERERLAAILQELQIGVLNLSDDSLKEVCAILSAQVILFPEPLSYTLNQETQSEVSLRLVEIKTTKIVAAFSSQFSTQTDSIQNAVSDLVNKTMQNLERRYPLKGRIASVQGHAIEINLGSGMGIAPDQSFAVLGESDNEPPKGRIQITSIGENRSFGRVLEKKKEFKTGDRLKAISTAQSE